MAESTNTMADPCMPNNNVSNTTGARSGVVDVRTDQVLQVEDESGHLFVEKECKSVEDAMSFLDSFMKSVKE